MSINVTWCCMHSLWDSSASMCVCSWFICRILFRSTCDASITWGGGCFTSSSFIYWSHCVKLIHQGVGICFGWHTNTHTHVHAEVANTLFILIPILTPQLQHNQTHHIIIVLQLKSLPLWILNLDHSASTCEVWQLAYPSVWIRISNYGFPRPIYWCYLTDMLCIR